MSKLGIPRLDIKGPNLIKGIHLEGLESLVRLMSLQLNIMKMVQMSCYIWIHG